MHVTKTRISEATKWMWQVLVVEAIVKKTTMTCNVYWYRYNIHWIVVEKATFCHQISNFPVFHLLELKFIAIAYGLIQYQVIIFINYRVNTFYLLHIHVGVLDELVSHTPSSTTSQTSSMSRSVYYNYIRCPISHTLLIIQSGIYILSSNTKILCVMELCVHFY